MTKVTTGSSFEFFGAKNMHERLRMKRSAIDSTPMAGKRSAGFPGHGVPQIQMQIVASDGEEPVVHRSSGPWGHRDRSAALDGSYPKTHEAADRIMTRALVSVAVGLRAADHQECRDADG